jgi:hypothetical protein
MADVNENPASERSASESPELDLVGRSSATR